eukprot:gene10706-3328_t
MATGLGFSETSYITNNSLVLWFLSPNTFFELKNHKEKKNGFEHFLDIKPEISFNTIVDNYNSFSFKINISSLQNQQYIFFTTHKIGNFNSNDSIIPQHQHVHIYKKSMLNTTVRYACSPEYLKPYRIFINAIPPIGIIRFIITTFVFLMLVYYRNKQPLKSRNYGPHYICLAQMMEFMVVSIRGSTTIEFEVKYTCFTDGLITFPMFFVSTCVILTYYSRYLIVNNLSRQKKTYANGKLPWFYVFLGGFDKISFFTVLPLIAYLYLATIIMTLLIIFEGSLDSCTLVMKNVIFGVQLFHILLNLVILILCSIYDFFSNIKLILRCQFKKLFVDQDPFKSRLELFVFVVTCLFCVSLFFTALFLDAPRIITYQIIDVSLIFFLVVSAIVPLFATIILHLSRICSRTPKIRYNDLELMIQDPVFLDALNNFCEKEYSPENLQFRLDHERYLKCPQNQRGSMIAKIDQKYLCSNSPYEVNLDGRSLREYRSKLEKYTNLDEFEDDLFEGIEKTVNMNLADSYGRFIYSVEYKNAVAKTSLLGKSFVKIKHGSVFK